MFDTSITPSDWSVGGDQLYGISFAGAEQVQHR
jgi:hypothetical protein